MNPRMPNWKLETGRMAMAALDRDRAAIEGPIHNMRLGAPSL